MASPHVSRAEEDTYAEIDIYLATTPNPSFATFEQQQKTPQDLQRGHISSRADVANHFLHNLPAPSPSSIYSPDMTTTSPLISPSQPFPSFDNFGPSPYGQSFMPSEDRQGEPALSFTPTFNFRTPAEAYADSYARLVGQNAYEQSPIARSPGFQLPRRGSGLASSSFEQLVPGLDQYETSSPISPTFAPSLPQGPFQPLLRQYGPQIPSSPTGFNIPTSPHTPVTQLPIIQTYTTPQNSTETFAYLERARIHLLTVYLREFPGGASRIGLAMIKRQIVDDMKFFMRERVMTEMSGILFTDEEMIQRCETALETVREHYRMEQEGKAGI